MQYIHNTGRAKHRRSGTVMQKEPSHDDKWFRNRKVSDGFPVDRKFENTDDVNTYLGGDTVQCLLCGRSFKNLGIHLKRIHEMDSRDYCILYNIPTNKGLLSSDALIRKKESISDPQRENMSMYGRNPSLRNSEGKRGIGYFTTYAKSDRDVRLARQSAKAAAVVNTPHVERADSLMPEVNDLRNTGVGYREACKIVGISPSAYKRAVRRAR